MSIQEINKSLVLINLVGSQHKTQQLVDVANDFIVMITELNAKYMHLALSSIRLINYALLYS